MYSPTRKRTFDGDTSDVGLSDPITDDDEEIYEKSGENEWIDVSPPSKIG